MSMPSFTFHVRDLTINGISAVGEPALRAACAKVFDAWRGDRRQVESPNDHVELQASLDKKTEGQSAAEVWELTFRRAAPPPDSSYRFILRVHTGADATALAGREREIVRMLGSTGSDCFSSNLLERFESDSIVAYRHVDDQLGTQTSPLKQVLKQALEREDDHFNELITGIESLAGGVTVAYRQISGAIRVISGGQYYRQLRNRLLPDLIVDARTIDAPARTLTVGESTIEISAADGSMGPKNHDKLLLQDTAVFAKRVADGTLDAGWMRLKVWFVRRNHNIRNQFTFQSDGDGARIWLYVDDDVSLDSLSTERPYTLLFNTRDPIVTTAFEQLRAAGFSSDSCLLPDEFEAFCDQADRVYTVERHTDLHCGNILYGPGRPKIIDLVSVDRDLAPVSRARLEVSLWYHVIAQIDITAEEILQVLSLVGSDNHDYSSVGPISRRLARLFSAIRSGFGDLAAPREEQEKELSLAYLSQVLLHQRYCIERMRENAVALPFDTVARYWTGRYKAAVSAPMVEPESSATGVDTTTDQEVATETLGGLWALAVRNPRTDIVEAHSQRFLTSIAARHSGLLNSQLTELQADVLRRWPETRAFQSNEHIIIAGPTSCGKSTLAEMFLVGPPLWNKQRSCTLYIAPTRALAQAKYRELDRLLKGAPELHAGLVLSTGEDSDDDWRITHARFTIGCLVYEKANILFSQNRKLLRKLACVVVDEMHMLTDLERGPVLELCALKVLMERKHLDYEESRDPAREALRVVAISTEDRPDAALKGLLSVHSPVLADRSRPPIVFHGRSRPVTVEHRLLLAPKDGESFSVEKIIEFKSADQRTLSKAELQEIDGRLDRIWQSTPYQALLNSRKDPRKEMHARLTEFLLDRLADRPTGYRALVFVPGRAEAENLAQRLRNRLMEQTKAAKSVASGHDEIYQRLKAIADVVDDQRSAEIVRRCSAHGILIHHADIDRKIRTAIEESSSTLSPNTASQIIFATETLSYGVNLALNDVVLLGTTFFCQSRTRELQSEPLNVCAFHNMAGRAGRLGKTAKGGRTYVYVVVPFDEKPMGVVERYYTAITPLMSQLYVEDDKQHQYRIEDNKFAALFADASDPCAKYKGLTALQFSYPYVRSVLDALRHLNASTAGNIGSTSKTPKRYEELIELFGNSLYAFQKLDGPASNREITMFGCALRRILDSCAEIPLELVKIEQGKDTLYSITLRGESIIDTGTELHTVEPMLRSVGWLHNMWQRRGGGGPFPVEFYILSVVAQREVHRNYIRYTPECRNEDAGQSWNSQLSDVNREAVIRSMRQSVQMFCRVEPAAIAEEVRQFLDDWEPVRQIQGAYTHAAADGIMRMFSGLVAWINGKERSVVEDLIEVVEGAEGLRTKFQGFKQFTDRISWKILFLAKMLSTSNTTTFTPEDERRLHLLVARLRLGCTAEAIPLFWPHSSDFRRQQAVALLDAGMSPERLVCMQAPQKIVSKSVKITPEKLDRLCRDLEKFAIKELTELAEEMTAVEARDARREAVHRIWRELIRLFPKAIRQFRQSAVGPLNFDGGMRECFDPEAFGSENGTATLGPKGRTLDERFRIRIDSSTGRHGIDFVPERSIREPQAGEPRAYVRQSTLRLLFLQMRRDWFCRWGDGNWMEFAELLRQHRSTSNLVIVPIPWIPSIESVPQTVLEELHLRHRTEATHTIFLSPAAFGTVVASIARDFMSGESFVKLILNQSVRPTFVGVKDIQSLLSASTTQLPQSIREKLIRHFEVEPFAFETLGVDTSAAFA